ncbi:TPA: hypothetical protein ACQNZQ_000285 [Streptococcus pyogenes]
MKTKSKRFLNLATLCLALLGTTLLMAHPVKAEAVKRSEGSDKSKVQEQSPYEKGKLEGYKAGLDEGKKKEAPSEPSKKLPDSIPYDTHNDKYYYRLGYEEGYTQGYYKGKSESGQSEQDDISQESQEKGKSESGQSEQDDISQEKGKSESGQSEQDDISQESLSPIFDAIVGVFQWIYTWVFGD